jgi:hypothetical protein
MRQPDEGHRALVIFTSLAIAGAGAIATGSIGAAGVYAPAASRLVMFAGVLLLAAGLAASTWHLGRRDRALLAARGLSQSAISREGALGVLTVALAALALTNLPGAEWARVASAISAVAFLGSVGMVYRVGGQLTWSGFSAATPVTAGLAFGMIFADSLPPWHAVSTLTIGAIALDTFVFSRRWRQVLQVAVDHQGSLGPGFERRHELLAGRFFLLNVLPCVLLFLWPTPLAAALAGAGIVVDRIGFYALGLQHLTETEIGRVERFMDHR